MAKIDIGQIIDLAGVIKNVLHKEADKPNTSLQPVDVTAVTNAVTTAVKQEVNPILVNATNSEPFYQSRIFWGTVVSIGVPLAGAALPWLNLIPQDQLTNVLVAGGAAAGGLFTLWGRFGSAKKPLGS